MLSYIIQLSYLSYLSYFSRVGNVLADGQPDIRTMHCARPVSGNLYKYGVNVWICDSIISTDDSTSGDSRKRKRKKKNDQSVNSHSSSSAHDDNSDNHDINNNAGVLSDFNISSVVATATITNNKSKKATIWSCLKHAERVTELYNHHHHADYFTKPIDEDA